MTERAIEAAARDSYEQGDQYYGAWDSLDPILREYAIKNAGITIRAYLTALAEDNAAVEAVARAMHKQSRPMSDPDKLQPKPRGQVGMEPLWKMYEPMARAAIRAMGGDHD